MIPQQAIELIKSFEGFRDKTYVCIGGKKTIGYGHTKGVKDGQKITEEQAESFLIEDMQEAYRAVRKLVKVPLNENQLSALLSFVFNVGAGNFFNSTLLSQLNKGFYEQVPIELLKWDKAKGQSVGGLARRRRAEVELFNKR